MLTSSTKQKIDNARDILVGKIPTPTGQVEHITLALMYKFMNDMDEINRELGGTAKFFSGDYRQYSWKQIMDRSLSAYERVTLYGEGLEKMSRNPNIPTLFREIFKRAFLPFRDPEVLTLFLKQIDEFSYDHSEELGNAFEYLLSIMGTQGEAGQLRSPRHIIDFMVKAVDPKKTDRILDPACGTAGFLISAYKHILEENTVKGSNRAGTKLTIEERKRLAQNFVGYDISHDMVRLSLVNMYLHEFPDPKIYEYDTLTSEERWDEDFDCILANPPFMTPKGGIRPHRRFSIQANRSEVLFVDYIMEHLSPNGKAGVIVPEGIIFQSANAYKALRKMFVEQNYIYAVVSLPAGVFQPYSGVKTSILLMDRVLAKKTGDILFVKIENDGFDLGAQRRPIDRNDLPKALELLLAYKKALVEGKDFASDLLEESKGLIVPKSRIAESGDFNLTGDRYKEAGIHIHHEWPMVELGDERFFQIESGGTPSSDNPEFWNGNIKWVTLVDLPADNTISEIHDTQRKITEKGLKNSSAKLLPTNSVLISSRATIGRIAINKIDLATNQGFKNIVIKDFNKIDSKFIAFMVTKLVGQMLTFASGGTFKEISKSNISKLKIPLPPLEVQRAIVAEIDGYQKIIDGAKQVVRAYKPQIKIEPEWEMVELKDVCDVRDGTHDSPKYAREGYPLITSKNIVNGSIDFENVNLISEDDLQKINKRSKVDDGDIIMPMIGTIGSPVIVKKEREFAIKNVALIKFAGASRVLNKFLKYVLDSDYFNAHYKNSSSGSTQKFISLGFIRSLQIPLPPLDTQKQIVAQIEGEQRLVEANKKLVEIFERKIRERIDEVWGRET